MRSRFAVAAMLVAGFTLSGAGAAVGASVIATQSDSASAAQYGTPTITPPRQQGTPLNTPPQVLGDVTGGGGGTPTSTPSGETLGETASGGEGEGTPPSIPAGGTLGESASSAEGASSGESASSEGARQASAAAQAPRQLSTGTGAQSDGLPFTGYASGLVLILGLALLVTGFTLRRSIGRAPAQP